jgi:protocadherin Fat 4
VTDTNDNPPFWEKSAYSFDVDEDALPGQIVGTLNAVDLDKGVNGKVTYSILSGWGDDVFSLNPNTGLVTLTGKLDYENVQHYIFVVQAQDTGIPSLSSTTTVYLNVLDLNDNSRKCIYLYISKFCTDG